MKILIAILIIGLLLLLWYGCSVMLYRKKAFVLADLNIQLPTSWASLTDAQQLYAVRMLLTMNDQTTVCVHCFLHFSNLLPIGRQSDIWTLMQGKKRIKVDNDTISYFALHKLDFIIHEQKTNIQPLSSVAGQNCIHRYFEGVPFKMWMSAENFYQAYLYTRKDYYLKALLSVYYCLGYYENVNDFSDADTSSRIVALGELPSEVLFSAFLLYASCKDRLNKRYSSLFELKQKRENEVADVTPPKMRELFDNMVYVLSAGDPTKDIGSVECARALDTLDKKASENNELKKRINKPAK